MTAFPSEEASDAIRVDEMQKAIRHIATRIVESEDRLTSIDSVIGDGDHGIGMRIGFGAVGKLLDEHIFTSINELFRAVGIELIRTMGGASGVLFGSLFIGGLHALPETRAITLRELAAFLDASVGSIRRRGKAAPGDKTMVDALVPAVQALRRSADGGEGILSALAQADRGAEEGMESTKAMVSRIGRARNFGDLALGHPDAGAVSVSIFFKALHEYFRAVGAT